jgi:hypothetical protein
VRLAIKCVRDHYRTASGRNNFDDAAVRAEPGHFTYDGHKGSVAMAACGVVCLQEFGEYDDWRIPRSMDYVRQFCQRVGYGSVRGSGKMSLDAFTLYYVAQALYQSGGDDWEQLYPKIRDNLVLTQRDAPEDPDVHGSWEGARITAKTDLLYGTSVACFVLAIPNRYLPILQEGGIYQRRATTGK